MEIRRLQRTGGSSITITLPKKWILSNDLKDKDLVKITSPTPQSLKLQPANLKKQIQKTVLRIDNLTTKMITRELISHYISGSDEIIVQSERISPEQRNDIRTISNFLTGFEMIDESSQKILLKNIFDPSKFPIPKNIEKMFYTTISMFADALKAFMQNDKTLARDVIQRDFEIDKLHLMITRQRHSMALDKISEEDIDLKLEDLYYFEDVAAQLERIADHGVKIARLIGETDVKFEKVVQLSTSFNNIAEKITKQLKDANDMVRNLDRSLAHQILDATEEIKIPLLSNLKVDQEEIFILNLIEDSFDRVRGYTMNIAEITIDQSVEKENK